MVGIADPSFARIDTPPDEVIYALLAGVVRVRRRVEIYEADAVTKFNIPFWDQRLIDGTVTLDRERDERRMCDITLDNTDRLLINDPYNGFWFDKVLKVFWGVRYFDTFGIERYWEAQVGEFMIDRIDEGRFPHTVKITGRDYAKKCLLSRIQYSLQFPSMTPVESIIQALAANAGITKFALPNTHLVYNKDIVFERGKERWAVMKDVADTVAHEVFFRADGKLTMAPYPDPTYDPLIWTFQGGEGEDGDFPGSLVKYERSSNDSNIFNHILVAGASAQNTDGLTETVFAEARNDDPGSPTRISRIGDRVKPPIQSDYIISQGQAQQLAQSLLNVSALEEYTINFESVVLPWIDVGTVVGIEDDSASIYTPKRFLLSSLSIPLKLGAMSGVGRRVTMVGSTQAWGVS